VRGIYFEETCSTDLFLELGAVVEENVLAVRCKFEKRLSDVFSTEVRNHC
jgi:hypothetical protein